MRKVDLVIIGGGPAGLAAAISAYNNGVKDILILERDERLGGILNQCIHNGFGLTRFKESLTGPEYANRFIEDVKEREIKFLTETTVVGITKDKVITAINSESGIFYLRASAIILAMGCRERSKGSLNIAGTRPAGIFSAGTAQKYVNIKGYLPGKKVVILGSGDIGLIMARRMTLEGAEVKAVFELMPYSSGLKRNISQCLNDFHIPLYLSHTLIKIEGKNRVTGVVASKVDENKIPIKGTEKYIECDTVLFSVGLIPENELSKNAGVEISIRTKGAIVDEKRETSIDGIFACGNVLHVHDLVDFVSEEAEIAGCSAANYVINGKRESEKILVKEGANISYVLPQKINKNFGCSKIFFRVSNQLKDVTIKATCDGEVVFLRKKRISVPGEMETLILTEDKLDGLKGDIVISAEVE